jgi:phage repressor protein C with HTH and peptisase S24 domain
MRLNGGVGDLLETIDEALKARGLSDAEASRLASGKPHLIKNLRFPQGEKARPNYYAIKALADVLGLELYFGFPREGMRSPPPVSANLTLIPCYELAVAAGDGHIDWQEAPTSYVAFRADWLHRMGLAAQESALINVKVSSMEPEFHDGDLVLLDRRRQDPRIGSIYVFRDIDHTIRVKRLASAHESLYFKSRSDHAPDIRRAGPDAERIHIIGRAVWVGRTLE